MSFAFRVSLIEELTFCKVPRAGETNNIRLPGKLHIRPFRGFSSYNFLLELDQSLQRHIVGV